MVWLETINIRSAGIIEARKVLGLCKRIVEATKLDTALRFKVYCNAMYATDISIHLQWKSEPGPSSVLGKELISALRDIGLISHAVWIEQEELTSPHSLEINQGRRPHTRRTLGTGLIAALME
ncbi:MAG: hypothetical protein P4L55_05785 [Syntrophobacteraceae bacterium]|nr:hypothetical protein [Syntrophobacteraceae bacterium]